jgi:hypothetical protein
MLKQLGFAIGCEQGTCIADALKIECSADTFLRLIRQTQLTTHPTLTHLEVDDWVFRRKVPYDTTLGDLQDYQIVDLLPSRSATSLVYSVKAGMLHPYETYLHERWQQGCRNGSKLYQEIVAYHCTQTKTGVMDYTSQQQGLTPRAAVCLLLRRSENPT